MTGRQLNPLTRVSMPPSGVAILMINFQTVDDRGCWAEPQAIPYLMRCDGYPPMSVLGVFSPCDARFPLRAGRSITTTFLRRRPSFAEDSPSPTRDLPQILFFGNFEPLFAIYHLSPAIFGILSVSSVLVRPRPHRNLPFLQTCPLA
jgi:hypothetical protein